MNAIQSKAKSCAGLLFLVLVLAACSGPQVRYGDAKAVETVNESYGSTDLQTIAEAMTRSLLQSKAISGSKDAPIITVADVKNKTSEYIDTSVITDKIRTQLLKSGQVRFAVNTNEMQNQVDELKRQNQSGLYKNSTISKTGNMRGAQYRIEGSISSIVKQAKNVKDVYYVFNLNLINNESGLLEWADEKEIRKTATR
jgi:penicillin-binding protein activator